MPASIKRYIHRTRTFTDDLAVYIRARNLNVQKMTLNFYPQEDGTFLYRDEVLQILSEHPEITFLSGGYHNLEFTKQASPKETVSPCSVRTSASISKRRLPAATPRTTSTF